jgi:CheY-like chemotaxis protein
MGVDSENVILLVEDNPDDALLVKRALVKADLPYLVQVAHNVEEAISYLEASGPFADRSRFPFPGVLISDVKLPRRGGLEVLKWLQGHPECRVVPTIILSASDRPEDVKAAYDLGANSYLLKPHSWHDLEALIQLAARFWCRCLKPPFPRQC